MNVWCVINDDVFSSFSDILCVMLTAAAVRNNARRVTLDPEDVGTLLGRYSGSEGTTCSELWSGDVPRPDADEVWKLVHLDCA